MTLVSVELSSGTRRSVMFEGVGDLRNALVACNVRAMYDANGTLITPEALVASTKIQTVFALTPRSRAQRLSRGHIQSAWTVTCAAATFVLFLHKIDVTISPWWLAALAVYIGMWELSLGPTRCPRAAALAAIGTAVASAHWDDAHTFLVRLLYAAVEPRACTWAGCSLRHVCSFHWHVGDYCAQLLRERVCTSVSYLLGGTGFALVWGSTHGLPIPIRIACACGVAYCTMVICRAFDGVQWVPDPSIVD